MIKEFFMKQMAKKALKDAPVSDDQKDMMVNMISKNPELFQKIATESQELMTKEGMDQMTAAMKVAEKYKDELTNLAGNK